MRKIEFRGKDLDTGTSAKDSDWVYGLPRAVWDHGFEINGHQIDPSTLGQFTGLKDSKGAKIFEGDVIEFRMISYLDNVPRTGRVAIEWSNEDAGFVAGSYVLWKLIDQRGAVVIGNIYENMDLLEANHRME
ncbi:hypothetical protein FMM01_02045 [Schleiferilactobacillus harbinensis]|uniref:YopX family protein n=1 Tax=Schleiferilactobacillus harbinensis TaxID=304207 RepID=UPI00123B73C4|nr:YopX family protein [Schleiferilactobacillus harbinensis]QEU46196.1 hypothetical protein FMM01_02045 [Schleiferilactobacillus harbinensis]